MPGAPHTTTSKTFWSWKRLPTVTPPTSMAAARRTSPGFTPSAWARARSTWTSRVVSSGVGSMPARVTPSTPAMPDRISSALLVSTSGFWP